MSRSNLISIILAGGKGTRIKHKTPKVLLKIKNKTLIETSINLAEIFSNKINIVINKTLLFLKNEFKNCNFFLQKSSLGTGHAVKEFFKNRKFNKKNIFMILYADTPFILKSDINKMLKKIKIFDLVILAFKTNSNKGCGLIKIKKSSVVEIIEYKNSKKQEKKINICNSGIMIFNYKVQKVIKLIKKDAITNEFYLTDIVKISKNKNLSIGVVVSNDEIRSRGINDIKTYKKNIKYLEKNI
jgi:bifunctional UDP-N-acetylglucosamine pyrophosphorylase / glucosamine-1-phosphate N-acetyltransferase